jgi:hypothetical protein
MFLDGGVGALPNVLEADRAWIWGIFHMLMLVPFNIVMGAFDNLPICIQCELVVQVFMFMCVVVVVVTLWLKMRKPASWTPFLHYSKALRLHMMYSGFQQLQMYMEGDEVWDDPKVLGGSG